jgi:hypothetical protein
MKNPAPRCSAGTGLGSGKPCVVAGSSFEHSTNELAIQWIAKRCRVSAASAAAVTALAGLGQREAQHG